MSAIASEEHDPCLLKKTFGLATHFKILAKILLIFLHNFQWTAALSTWRARRLPRNTRASAAL